jgi:ComF family protein
MKTHNETPVINLISKLVDWIVPKCCCVCRADIHRSAVFCSDCFSKVVFIDTPICSICGKMLQTPTAIEEEQMLCAECFSNKNTFDICRSLFLYNDVSKRIVMKIKRQLDVELVKICVRMLLTKYGHVFDKVDLIVPVPSHWTRTLVRGYNPPAIIAAELSKIIKVPFSSNCLRRIKRTGYQAGKSTKDRVKNVKDAFLCSQKLDGKRVLLVDDVMTTGATINECANVLKNLAGVQYVICACIATTRANDI